MCIKTQSCFLWFYWFLFELTSYLFDKSSSPHFENLELFQQHQKQTLKDTCVDGVMQLTDDVCEQQGQGEREEWCRQSCALPVAAAVRLVEGKQWSGHTAARERPGRRRVHGSRCKRVALSRPWQQRRGTRSLLEQKLPVEDKYRGHLFIRSGFMLNTVTWHNNSFHIRQFKVTMVSDSSHKGLRNNGSQLHWGRKASNCSFC